MTLRDFIDDISDDQFISLKIGEYGFGINHSFRKYRVNRSSKLLDCKVQSIGSSFINDQIIINVCIELENLNYIKDFFNGYWLCLKL